MPVRRMTIVLLFERNQNWRSYPGQILERKNRIRQNEQSLFPCWYQRSDPVPHICRGKTLFVANCAIREPTQISTPLINELCRVGSSFEFRETGKEIGEHAAVTPACGVLAHASASVGSWTHFLLGVVTVPEKSTKWTSRFCFPRSLRAPNSAFVGFQIVARVLLRALCNLLPTSGSTS